MADRLRLVPEPSEKRVWRCTILVDCDGRPAPLIRLLVALAMGLANRLRADGYRVRVVIDEQPRHQGSGRDDDPPPAA